MEEPNVNDTNTIDAVDKNLVESTTESAPENQVQGTEHASDENIRYVPKDVFKQLKKQQQHMNRIQKKREERWAQPFADAKIEDVSMVYERCLTELEVLRRALIMKGLLTNEDTIKAREFQQKRIEKANELKANTDMSVEDKRKVCAEWDIPVEAIGLQPETTNIPEQMTIPFEEATSEQPTAEQPQENG
jgi:cytochrome c-type biogenesis protein CcmE